MELTIISGKYAYVIFIINYCHFAKKVGKISLEIFEVIKHDHIVKGSHSLSYHNRDYYIICDLTQPFLHCYANAT